VTASYQFVTIKGILSGHADIPDPCLQKSVILAFGWHLSSKNMRLAKTTNDQNPVS
jgi:hypothetical protein